VYDARRVSLRSFGYPALAEEAPITVRVEGAASTVCDVPAGSVAFVVGDAADLEAIVRTTNTVTLRVRAQVDVRIHDLTKRRHVAGGDRSRPRFRVELADERRRVRVRKEVMDIRSPSAASHEWIEDEDAELPCLVRCLRSPLTKREEKDGRLELNLTTGEPDDAQTVDVATVSVDEMGVVEVAMMSGYWELPSPVGW
jgi:hypothetical protein